MMKKYAELRGNPENCRIKSRQDNTIWHQEYGTVHQGGQPHVRPALEANRDQLVKIMAADTLKEALGL